MEVSQGTGGQNPQGPHPPVEFPPLMVWGIPSRVPTAAEVASLERGHLEYLFKQLCHTQLAFKAQNPHIGLRCDATGLPIIPPAVPLNAPPGTQSPGTGGTGRSDKRQKPKPPQRDTAMTDSPREGQGESDAADTSDEDDDEDSGGQPHIYKIKELAQLSPHVLAAAQQAALKLRKKRDRDREDREEREDARPTKHRDAPTKGKQRDREERPHKPSPLGKGQKPKFKPSRPPKGDIVKRASQAAAAHYQPKGRASSPRRGRAASPPPAKKPKQTRGGKPKPKTGGKKKGGDRNNGEEEDDEERSSDDRDSD